MKKTRITLLALVVCISFACYGCEDGGISSIPFPMITGVGLRTMGVFAVSMLGLGKFIRFIKK